MSSGSSSHTHSLPVVTPPRYDRRDSPPTFRSSPDSGQKISELKRSGGDEDADEDSMVLLDPAQIRLSSGSNPAPVQL